MTKAENQWRVFYLILFYLSLVFIGFLIGFAQKSSQPKPECFETDVATTKWRNTRLVPGSSAPYVCGLVGTPGDNERWACVATYAGDCP